VQVQTSFFGFDHNMAPVWKPKGKDLLHGETDGSSYPNGGMCSTKVREITGRRLWF
jgi:glutamine synthetase